MSSCFLLAEKLRNADGLTPLAYTHQELVDIVLKSLRDCEPSLKHKFWSRGLHRICWPVDEYGVYESEKQLLDEYWEIFNELFFLTSLSPPRSRWWFVEQDELIWDGMPRHGDAEENRLNLPVDFSRHEIDSVIFIYEVAPDSPRKPPRSPKERLQGYIQTLLHEMIHAFINNYACFCSRCKKRYKQQAGRTGHGLAWRTIAYKVENFVHNELGLELDLNRVVAAADELYKPGLVISQAKLGTYNVDSTKLADELYRRSIRGNGTFIIVESVGEHGLEIDSSSSSDDSSNGEYANSSGDDSEDQRFCPRPDNSSSNEYDDGVNTTSVEDSSEEHSEEEH